MAGREHVAERREDSVEGPVLERELLGVPLDPPDVDAHLGGLPASVLQELGDEVEPRHAGAAGGRGDRGVAGPASDVEDRHPFLDPGARDDQLADVRDVL
jgi:hypothetical protein